MYGDHNTAVAQKLELAIAHYRLGLAYSHAGRKKEAQEQMVHDNKYRNGPQEDIGRRMRQVTLFVVKEQNRSAGRKSVMRE